MSMLILILIVATENSFAYEFWTDQIDCKLNITDDLQEYIVQFHNDIRSDVARGDFVGYKSGTNIYSMRWDCDLARLAQERANSCKRNRESDHFANKLAEITYQQPVDESKINDDYFEEAMEYWSNSTETLNQIISGQTLLLGCGINKCQEIDIQEIFIICQYWPIAKKLYKTGPPCQSWKDCTAYKKSFCYHDTNLCDYDGTEEVHDSFHVFLASNGTISISNLEQHSTTSTLLSNSSHKNTDDNNNVTAQLCNKQIMNDDIRSDILLKHNLIRSQLAHGYFKSLPSGSNIYSLQWSCELEGFAQRYAEFLSDICKLSRKQEIHLPFEIGQNIFKTRTKGNHTTEQWFDEALHFWTNGARESGSVAQILYGKTLLMGCGIHKCPGTEVVIVCQYWPKAIPGLLYEPSSSCETNDYCDAYNRSSCQSKMSLCKIPDSFAFPYPLRAIQFQTTKTDAIYSKDGANSSKASEKIIEKFEKQNNCNGTKLHGSYRSLLNKKHEEYRKRGIMNLHNFEHIEEDFFFKLYWNCELEREAQMEVENCVMPSSGAQHKYYRTTIFNFEFDNLTTFLEQKTDRAIRNWWGNPMDNDNINIAQYEATDIGCGIAICVDENLQMVLDIVCRYWPTSDPNQLYSYAISCAQDEDCSSLPNSYCDTDLEICVEDK